MFAISDPGTDPAYFQSRSIVSENIYPKSYSITNNGKLEINWSEGNHTSVFDPLWLRNHCYTINSKKKYKSNLDHGQKLWKRANAIILGGNSFLSKNPNLFLPNKWPTYFSRSKGCKVWDLNNKTPFCRNGDYREALYFHQYFLSTLPLPFRIYHYDKSIHRRSNRR